MNSKTIKNCKVVKVHKHSLVPMIAQWASPPSLCEGTEAKRPAPEQKRWWSRPRDCHRPLICVWWLPGMAGFSWHLSLLMNTMFCTLQAPWPLYLRTARPLGEFVRQNYQQICQQMWLFAWVLEAYLQIQKLHIYKLKLFTKQLKFNYLQKIQRISKPKDFASSSQVSRGTNGMLPTQAQAKWDAGAECDDVIVSGDASQNI